MLTNIISTQRTQGKQTAKVTDSMLMIPKDVYVVMRDMSQLPSGNL